MFPAIFFFRVDFFVEVCPEEVSMIGWLYDILYMIYTKNIPTEYVLFPKMWCCHIRHISNERAHELLFLLLFFLGGGTFSTSLPENNRELPLCITGISSLIFRTFLAVSFGLSIGEPWVFSPISKGYLPSGWQKIQRPHSTNGSKSVPDQCRSNQPICKYKSIYKGSKCLSSNVFIYNIYIYNIQTIVDWCVKNILWVLWSFFLPHPP